MEYIAVYTALLDHPKTLALSDREFRVLMRCWLYAGRHDTHGYVPELASKALGFNAKVRSTLEADGWLDRNGAGWAIHDWDEHQQALIKAIERKHAKREKDRERIAGKRADVAH